MANSKPSPNAVEPAAPAGAGDYVVAEAECINAIAVKHGFFWQTIWNDPNNAALKTARKDHNILMPGDQVHIPELRLGSQSCATGQRHSFVRKGVPSRVQLKLLEDGSADRYANQAYRLIVDGKIQEGTVDGDGVLDLAIDPCATGGSLTVAGKTFELKLGGLDPVDSIRGAQQRLKALGFLLQGSAEERWNEEAVDALKRFQALHLLKNDEQAPTGEYDSKTRDKLAEIYGC